MAAKHFFRNLKDNLQNITDSEYFTKRNIVLGLLLGILVLSLPIGVQLVQHQQQLKSRADVDCPKDNKYCENGQKWWEHAGELDDNGECQYAYDRLPEEDNQCIGGGGQPPLTTAPALCNNRVDQYQNPNMGDECAVCLKDNHPGLYDSIVGNCRSAIAAGRTQTQMFNYWCNGGYEGGQADCQIKKGFPACAQKCGVNLGTVNLCGVDKQWAQVDLELWNAGQRDVTKYDHGSVESTIYTNTACPAVVSTPTSFSATCNNGQTTISWGSNATIYDVRINGPARSSLPNNCSGHNVCLDNYNQKNIVVAQPANSTITYWVHAVDTAGRVGISSEVKSFTCQGTNDSEKPTSTVTLSPASSFHDGDLITLTFNATDTGGSGVKLIHTALKEGVINVDDAKRDGAAWAASYQGKRTGTSRQARIPFYLEYLAEDNAGNLETVHGQVFTAGGSTLTPTSVLTSTPVITGVLTLTPTITPGSSICTDDKFYDTWLSELPGIGSKATKTADCNGDRTVDILDFNMWRNFKFNLSQ